MKKEISLYIKERIDDYKSEDPTLSDDEIFDIVMKDMVDMMLDYTLWDLEMDLGIGKD